MRHSYRKEFYDIYTNKLLPKFIKYEKYRKKIITEVVLAEIFFLIIALGSFWISIITVMNKPEETAFKFWCFMMSLVVAGFMVFLMFASPIESDKKFRKKLKDECLSDAIACFEGLTKGYSGITNSQIASSQLFGEFNEVYLDDQFYCKYKNVEFSASEALLKYIYDSGKNRTEYNAFKGVIIRIPMKKKVNAHTIITSKGDDIVMKRNILNGFLIFLMSLLLIFMIIYAIPNRIFGEKIILNALSLIFLVLSCLHIIRKQNKIKLNKLKLEDVSFDKRFCVQSQDQVEGRYLVTPAFMEKLNNLQMSFGTKDIKCAFFSDQIMFAISTDKNLFELGNLFVPLSNSKQINEFYNEISSIYDMIDYFKLYEKTYRHCE